jgi:hypothetical protein
MISTRDLSALPDVKRFKAVLQSMAMLDAILCPEWQYRYFSFNAHWAADQAMGSMRDGSGDDFFALFNVAGCLLKGFAHESAMTPYAHDPPRVLPGILDGVPPEFRECLSEPAFSMEDTTFCIWRRYGDASWQRGDVQFLAGPDPDGSGVLLSPLDGKPQTYQKWAEGYYERPVDLGTVRQIYKHKRLTDEMVARLNPDLSLQGLANDIEEIGYPG